METKKWAGWLVLTVIAAVAAVALALTNQVTEEPIRQQNMARAHGALVEMFPEADDFQAITLSESDELQSAYTAKKAGETVAVSSSKTRTWYNTNHLIHTDNKYYCPYAIGLKTGQTPTAGSCLLSGFECAGKTLVIGVFGCPEEDDRFADTIQLFNEWIESK